MLVRLNLGTDDIVMLAAPHVFPQDPIHKYIVYPDLKESIAAHLKEISVEDFGQMRLDEKGTPYVSGKKSLPNISVNDEIMEEYLTADNGFKEDIQMLYHGLRCGITNIEKVWREPWLPVCEPDDFLADAGYAEVYREAWALMNECVLGEITDRCDLLFMTINKVLGFKSGRRTVISGTVETGLMKRGRIICSPTPFGLPPQTITAIEKNGKNVDSADEGDTVIVTLYDEDDYDDATGTYYDNLHDRLDCSCMLAYGKQLKYDHKKLADMMNEKCYRPEHSAAVSTKMIRRELHNGGTSNLLQFVAESIGFPEEQEE